MKVALQNNVHLRISSEEIVGMCQGWIGDLAREVPDFFHMFHRKDDYIGVIPSKPEGCIFVLEFINRVFS
jgi:hypothetical protein